VRKARLEIVAGPPEGLAKRLRDEIDDVRELVAKAGLKIN
jgi:hypothetical protein